MRRHEEPQRDIDTKRHEEALGDRKGHEKNEEI